MILTSGSFNVGHKPLLRWIAIACASFLTGLMVLRLPLWSRSDASYLSKLSACNSLNSFFSNKPCTSTPVYRYELPQDLVLPQTGQGIAAESWIGKVTMVFNARDPTYIRALQTHEAHDRRFGYPLLILRHSILDDVWSKPAYILAALLEEMRKPERDRLKWLFWVDADTVITNPNVPLDIFLPPQEFSHVHLLVTADPNGLNNGVFFIKVDPWSIKLLSSVVAYRIFHPETQLTFRDQSALGEVLKEQPFKKSFLLLPQRWFNAYQVGSHDDNARSFQIRRGDLLVHFPGVTNRDECMGKYLDRAERHMPDWELDLASTSYPNEIKEYWATQYEILSQERNKTQQAAKDAEALLGKVESQLGIHRSNLGNSIVETVEQHMKSLKTTLNDHKDDLEALTTASKILIGATTELHELVNQAQKALHKQAHAAIVDSEAQILQDKNSSHQDLVSQLQSRIESLRELLVREPDNVKDIASALEQVEKFNGDLKAELARD